MSHHIGDLENYETLKSFVDGIAHFKNLFAVEPAVIAHDLHPEYLSTKYAVGIHGLTKVAVQHHHAHIASCMAEHGLNGPVIGVAFRRSWLRRGRHDLGRRISRNKDFAGYERRAHLRNVSLWRVATERFASLGAWRSVICATLWAQIRFS